MVSRSEQAKRMKMKKGYGRKKRYARFSGKTASVVTRTVERLEHEGEDRVRVKEVEVYVGLKSLSNQIVNTGRGPNPERMVQYYERLASLVQEPRTMGELFGLIKDPRYAQVWWDTPAINKINLVDDVIVRLDLFFSGPCWFFVELNMDKKTIRRSRDYGSKNYAMMQLSYKRITWVEQIPMSLPV